MRVLMWLSHIFAIITICSGLYGIFGSKPWNPLFWILPLVLSTLFKYLSEFITKRNKNKSNQPEA